MKTKKLLAVIMSLVMTITAIPMFGMVAFAEEETAISVGDIIEYGSYPQIEVTDESLLNELNSQELEWISYEYYSGTPEEQQVPGDFMKYADVTYNGNKYRAVTFTEYRPFVTAYDTSEENSYQAENGYETGVVYWFEYEPIKWCVLDPEEGIVLSELLLDSQEYYYERELIDYASSSIREWLNEDFYNTAFSDAEKSEIFNYVQDNTSPFEDAYDGETTYDKVFLLSYDDARNKEYGFASNKLDDASRRAYGTDYAKCQGLSVEGACPQKYSMWWLRTADRYNCPSYIEPKGEYNFSASYYPFLTCFGIRPAMKINLNQAFDVKDIGDRFSIMTPTRTEIRYKDGVILHAEVEGNAPAGSYVKWYVYDDNILKTHTLDYGYAFEVVSENDGETTVLANLYDENGNLLARDSIEIQSDAGLFQKITGIFRVLFNHTSIYVY